MELVHERGQEIAKAVRESALSLHGANGLDDDHLAVDVQLHGRGGADCLERSHDVSSVIAPAELFEQRIPRLPWDDDRFATDRDEDVVRAPGAG
jgi:hypothetical protein